MVTNSADHAVVEATLGRSARGASDATFRTAHGQWRIEARSRRESEGTGKWPRPMWRDVIAPEDLVVVDDDNQDVATLRGRELRLVDGESLIWVGSRIWSGTCGLGGDLWIAKGLRPRRRGFRAELSEAMLAREDGELLTGVASILTHVNLTGRGAVDVAGIGADF